LQLDFLFQASPHFELLGYLVGGQGKSSLNVYVMECAVKGSLAFGIAGKLFDEQVG
jgi:hypothetical protein